MCDSDVSVVLNRWAPLLNDDWPPSTVGCCRIGSYEPTPGASEAFAYWPRFVLDAKPLVCLASGLPGSTIVYEPGPGEAPSPGWTSSCRALDVEPKPPAPDCNDLPKLFFESVPSSVAVCGSYEPGSPMKVSSASLPRFVLDLNAAEPAFCTGMVRWHVGKELDGGFEMGVRRTVLLLCGSRDLAQDRAFSLRRQPEKRGHPSL